MSRERKEPTLSTSKTNIDTSVKTGNSRPSPKPRPQVVVQKQSQGLLWLSFLLAFGACVAGGYLFWQSSQFQGLVQQQQLRIDELESKLLLTGDESTQSLAVLAANLKTQEQTLAKLQKEIKLSLSEVDKLWATRNANVKAIEKASADLGKQIDEGDKQLQASFKQVESQQTGSLERLKQENNQQELLIQSLRERLTEQSKATKSLSSQIKQFAQATKDVKAISNKVDGYEESIRSIDKFRITTNRDLLLLKERAGVLSAPAQ